MQVQLSSVSTAFTYQPQQNSLYKQSHAGKLLAPSASNMSFKGDAKRGFLARIVKFFNEPISQDIKLTKEEISARAARKNAKNTLRSIVSLLNEKSADSIQTYYPYIIKPINRVFGAPQKGETLQKHIIKEFVRNPLKNPHQKAEVLFQTYIINEPDKLVSKLIKYDKERKTAKSLFNILRETQKAQKQALQSPEYKETIGEIRRTKKEVAIINKKFRRGVNSNNKRQELQIEKFFLLNKKDMLKAKLKDIMLEHKASVNT